MTIPKTDQSACLSTMRTSRFRFPDSTRKALLILLCLSSGAAMSVRAAANDKKGEKPYALIYGTVWGPDSRPIYGVKIKIRRTDQKRARWEVFSAHRGEFAQRVPPGPADFVVWADLKGYKTPDSRTLRLPEEVKVHITYDEREDIGVHLTY